MLEDRGFVETVQVTYDENKVSFESLIVHYFKVSNPTSVDKQGNDIDNQYRTGIYYINENDHKQIHRLLKPDQLKWNQ